MLKSMKFNPVKSLVKSGFGALVHKPCPRCGHNTLIMPGKDINLTDLGPETPMPVACCYPGCGYKNSDDSMSRSKLHAKHINDMRISQTENYFNNFSVRTDDDDFSKTFASFQTPTKELQSAKATAERIAKTIADGKTVHSFILGDTGIGKTHLSYAMINAIWQMTNYRCRVIFLNMFQLSLLHNKSIHDDNTRKWFDQLLYQIDKADLVIVDDMGREQNNNWNRLMVDVIANDRENKSVVITSNISACKRYSGQTLDRLKEHSKGFNIVLENTPSFRTVKQ